MKTKRFVFGASLSRTRGLSLLEVVLALAIFGGALVTIGQLNNLGRMAATRARDMTTAQIYCEEMIGQITIGSLPPDPVSDSPLPQEDGWYYSIETGSASQPGLIAVRVVVRQDEKMFARPVNYSLVRWIPEGSTEVAEESDSTSSSTGSSSSAAGGS